MTAQVVLNEKQSTYGSPYGFYTVTLTPSDRTKDSVTVQCEVSAHLQYSGSWTGYKVTCALYIGGEWTEFVIYEGGGTETNGKAWKGTTPRTVKKTITVTGLSAAQTKITDIKFKSTRSPVGGPQLDETECADLAIDLYGETANINVDGVWTVALPWVNVDGEWRTCIPWGNDKHTWRSANKIIEFNSDLESFTDDGQGNLAITLADTALVEHDGNGNVSIVATCFIQDAVGYVDIV